MKKVLFMLTVLLMSSTVQAQTADVNPAAALQAKKAEVEARIDAKQSANMEKIDAKIAKAKAAGKSTANLEQKKAEVKKRIDAKQDELNSRINAQKAKLQ